MTIRNVSADLLELLYFSVF